MIHLAHKIELKLNQQQAAAMRQFAGSARFVWNRSLAQWKQRHDNGEKVSELILRKELTQDKKTDELAWLQDIPQAVTANAIRNLGDAFKHFFRRLKTGEKPGFPRFKKKGMKESFSPWDKPQAINVQDKRIRIPRLGWVRMREVLRFRGDIISATISETAGKWFVSITVAMEQAPSKHRTGENQTGIDLGCSTMATLSDGTKIEGPKPLRRLLGRLQRLSRGLSRKKKGSANRGKAKRKVAKLHSRIRNIRQAAIHEMTTGIVLDSEVIAIEDLNVKGMVRLRSLARSLSDQSFYEIRRQLTYKADLYGCEVCVVDRWFPSSKLCSGCGNKKDDLTLSDRTYRCDTCELTIDRDVNAAINLRNQIPVLDRELTPTESSPLGSL